MDEFARGFVSKSADTLTCRECETQLAEYVEARVMGQSTVGYSQLEQHLQVCPHCRREYRELEAVLTSAYTEAAPVATARSRYDFSFLKPQQSRPFGWDDLGRLIVDLTSSVWQSPPRLAPAYVVKSEDTPDEAGAEGLPAPLRFSLGAPDLDDLQLDVTALPDRTDPARYTLVAKVEQPSRWPELAGVTVSLTLGDETRTDVTDESGEVTFSRIPAERLTDAQLRVAPATD